MNELTQILTIGGPPAVICTLFLYYIDRMDRRTKILIENHMEHNTDAVNKNTIVLNKLANIITSLGKIIKEK